MQVSSSRVKSLGGPAPMAFAAYDLGALGYVEEEFLLEGQASSYAVSGERTADGRWRANPAEEVPFVTRLVTRRPADAARFSGSVIVEWNNVSGGVDASPDWTLLHRELIRAGHAWMGVTAQKAGVDGGGYVEGPHLKKAFPERYAVLNHPGDAWSYDIFSQAGAALRGPAGLLGPLTAKRLVAAGESQSAMRLVTYINAVDPLAMVYDGFLVHGRGATGAGFDAAGARARPSPGDPGEQIRAGRPRPGSGAAKRDRRDRARRRTVTSRTGRACGCGRSPEPRTQTPTSSSPAARTTAACRPTVSPT